ncbi:MAG: hypothetical protein AAFZ65_15855, partial [Planctomycetota bacterium]
MIWRGTLTVAALAALLLFLVLGGSGKRSPAGLLEPGSPGSAPSNAPAAPPNPTAGPTERARSVAVDVAAEERTRAAVGVADAGGTFLVVDGTGAPVADALVRTIPWERRFWARGTWGGHYRPEVLVEAGIDRRTDAHGRADLDLERLRTTPHGTVVWAALPGHRLRQVQHDTIAAAPQPIRLGLEACASPRVRVVDADGAPRAGATVELLVPPPPALPFGGASLLEHACSTLALRLPVDADGRASLPGPPRAAVDDVIRVRAREGELCSEWYSLRPGAEATLRLVPSFALDGVVEGFDAFVEANDDMALVSIERESSRGWEPVAGLGVDRDGTFGSAALPFVAGARYRAHLDSYSAAPVPVAFEPVPGERVQVRLSAEGGLDRWGHVYGVDALGQRVGALDAFTAQVTWETALGPMRLRGVLDEPPGGQGLCMFSGLPANVDLRFEITAPGHAPLVRESVRIDPANEFDLTFDLAPARDLRGRLAGSHGGQLDALFVPRVGTREVVRRTLGVASDGRFELTDLPAVSGWLLVRAEPQPWSAPIAVEARSDRALELSRVDAAPRRGRVLDAVSGSPVVGAWVEWVFRSDDGADLSLPIGALSDAAGEFRLEADLASEPGLGFGLRLVADGYDRLLVSEPAAPSTPLEL